MGDKKISKKNNDNVKERKECKCVYVALVARELIRRGFVVIDIKPNSENHNKTVFVFEKSENFNIALENILSKYERKKTEREILEDLSDVQLKTLPSSNSLKPNFDVFEGGHPLYDPTRESTIDWDCD